MRKISLAILLAPVLAWAQPRTADEWYKEGENQYNLGNFDKAVDAFKQGFSLEPNESKKAAYLFNVAQSYRQAKDCKNAVFFYKRFLALKENDTVKPLSEKTRKDVEDRIHELEDCAKQQEAIREKPPDHNLKPDETPEKDPNADKTPPNKQVATKEPPEDDDTNVTKTTTVAPHVISARLIGGGSKVNTGDLNVPLQPSGALIAGYPLAIDDKLTIDIGAAFTFTPVPYKDMAMADQSASLVGLLADVGATYEVIPKLGLRGDVGIGALLFSGVSESPFTNFAKTTGALTMFHLRVGASADYAITPNLIATLAPIAFSYSPPKEGLVSSIKSITSIDFMIGVGYRM